MKKLTSFIAIALAFSFAQKQFSVKLNDCSFSKGNWKGTITYLDYSSGKPFTMEANTTVVLDTSNGGMVILKMDYPKEPKANGNDTLQLSNAGTFINGEAVIQVKRQKQGTVIVTTNSNGTDGNDNKKCTFRHTYSFYEHTLMWKKEVLFNGEKEWIKRNEFSFKR